MAGPLDGVRILDCTDESGRLAAKLLAEGGADVLRVRRGEPGPPMVHASGGVLDWWFDGGTRHVPLDLDHTADRATFASLAARADLLIETEPPGRLAALGIDHADLAVRNPALVHVSLTPFGRTGPRASWQASDLVAAAMGGVMAITGLPDAPLCGWGRQAFNVGGYWAAICALAGLHAARASGRGQHIDLSLQQAVLGCTEQLLMYWSFAHPLFPSRIAGRQASLHWSGLYQVMAGRDGHVMVTPAPNAFAILEWLAADGMGSDLLASPPMNFVELVVRAPEVMAALHGWVATKDVGPLVVDAQARRMGFGEVLSIPDAARVPQHAARGFFRSVDGVAIPASPARFDDTPAAPPLPPPAGSSTPGASLDAWPERPAVAPTASPARPLDGVRVLDFTWVLAGPQATRVLADLGADVVKLQTEARATGVNHDAFPFFLLFNRGKRSVALDMKHPQALAVMRRLIERADVVIENYAAGVLERWGIGWETVRTWNERLVYVSASGCGAGGPWSSYVTYAPTIHALSGLTHLTGPPGRHDVGMGFSLSDHATGLAAAVAILAALEARRRTGRGQHIDLSQLEVGCHLLGPAFVDHLANGRVPEPHGNRDPFADYVPNDVYQCRDGRWLALTARDDGEWRALAAVAGIDDPRLATADDRRRQRAVVDDGLATWAAGTDAFAAMERLQAQGVPAGVVQDASDLAERDPQLAARGWLVDVAHPTFGTQQLDSFPAQFAGTPLGPYEPAPIFGQHSFDVYGELAGMSVEEIAAAMGDDLFR